MTDRTRAIAGSTIILSTTFVLSLLLTMLRKGPSAFSTLSLAFMFVIFCFAGAIFYSVLKYRCARIMVFSVFIVTLVHLLVFRITEPRYFIEFFLYYAALGVSVLSTTKRLSPAWAASVSGNSYFWLRLSWLFILS